MLEKPIQRGGSIRKECLYIMHASKCQLLLHWGSHFLQSPARRTPLSSLWAQRGICQSNGEHWIAWQSANQPLWTAFSATVSFYMCFGSRLFCENIWEAVSWFNIFQNCANHFDLAQNVLFFLILWSVPFCSWRRLQNYSHQAHCTFF